jgi:hypothetical protein
LNGNAMRNASGWRPSWPPSQGRPLVTVSQFPLVIPTPQFIGWGIPRGRIDLHGSRQRTPVFERVGVRPDQRGWQRLFCSHQPRQCR